MIVVIARLEKEGNEIVRFLSWTPIDRSRNMLLHFFLHPFFVFLCYFSLYHQFCKLLSCVNYRLNNTERSTSGISLVNLNRCYGKIMVGLMRKSLFI